MLLQLIRKWLKKRLDIQITVIPTYFAEIMKDGTLLARILYRYDIITFEELQKVEETDDPAAAYDNHVEHISEWLLRLDIELSNDEIREITHGESSAAASLLYEMYMRLENQRGSVHRARSPTRRFKVEKVGYDKLNEYFMEVNPLCEPLIKQWDIINWEKDHLTNLLAKYMSSKEEYGEFLQQRKIRDMNRPSGEEKLEDRVEFLKAEKREYSYAELIAQQKKVLEMGSFEPNQDEARKIMENIKRKSKEREQRTAFRLELQHQLLAEVMKNIEEEEEEEFDKLCSEKLLLQSMHEKEAADKLLHIRQQKEVFIQNKKMFDESEKKRKEEEFVRRLFEEELEAKMKFHEENMAKIEEHKRLYEEKMRLKKLKHEKVCRDVLSDIVDLSLKTIEYREQYKTEPDIYTKRDWATLFLKEQPIFEIIPTENLPAECGSTIEEIDDCKAEMMRQKILYEQDFEDYLHFNNIWKIENLEELVKQMELGMNCLGYVVHKLLLKKYPIPVPQKPQLPQELEISVCANMEDLTRLDLLQRLLDLRSVKVIQVEDVISFCIKSYEDELKTEFDDPFPEEEYLRELSPTKEKSEKALKGGKKEKGKKEKPKKEKEKGGKKEKGKKGKEPSKIELPVPTLEEKQAQTPRLFPWEKIVFSNRAKLGRLAKEILGHGGVIDDKLFIDMFIEYLMSMPDIKGWVLLNYPKTYEQAALLEEALTGEPAPKAYYDKILNKESLASIELEESKESTESETSIPEPSPASKISLEEQPPSYVSFSDVLVVPPDKTDPTMEKCSSDITAITVQDDWETVSIKERLEQLAPDLKHLAYSSDEEQEEEPVQKQDKTCICVCNPPEETVKENKENVEDESLMMFDPPDVFVDEEGESVESSVNTEQNETKECSCFEVSVKEESVPVEKQEEVTQTNILGVEEEVETSDKPIERVVLEDVNEEKRFSKIVPNPRASKKEDFKTILTAYVRIKEKEELEDDYPLPKYEEFEKKNGLEKFYCDQGCFYLLEYEEFNSDTIKCLAKMIIGDYSLPWKTSVEIFGEQYAKAFLEVEDHKITKTGKEKEEKKAKKGKKEKKEKKSETKVGAKDKKEKKGKDKSKDAKSGKGKKGKQKSEEVLVEEAKVVEHEDKEVQVPFIEEEEDEGPEPRPGEPSWEYINLPIPLEIELSLANFWDNLEAHYTTNFKDLFFQKRIVLKTITHFLSNTKQTMSQFIERDDPKQYHLREFQKTLNEIDLDLRTDPQTKSQLLCMIDNFKEKLLGICDAKMREAEEERRNFIRQNWFYRQFCEITNNCTLSYQFEIDRLVDTIQFLSDYYTCVITKSTKQGYEFHKEVLPKHKCEDNESESFNKLFIDMESESEETEFHKFVENTKNIAAAFIESLQPLALKPLHEMKKLFEVKEKEKKPKKQPKAKQFEPDEDVKENAERIFEEWQCAIDGELARINLHLTVIKNEAFERFNEIIRWIKNIFKKIFDDISRKYENEILSVHKACELLMSSVEKEVIIRPELTFEGEQLVQIQISLFPETLIIDDDKDGSFKLEQLEHMVRILMDLAHTGYIMRTPFLLLIQDILYQDSEEESLTPKLWRNLTLSRLNVLFKKLFDEEPYLYWKDFIVCNLMVPFPTREQLMETRRQFRNFDNYSSERVTREEFNQVKFWFEESELDLDRLKSIIFTMYRTGEDEICYTAMLLDFCKDDNPIMGFVKALELSLGKFICYDQTLGERFVDEILEDRILFEQKKKEHEETIILAKKAVSLLIDKIIDQCEGPEGFDLREVEEHESASLSSHKTSSEESKLSEGKLISEQKFSYAQIGFETRDDTELCYFLPLGLVAIVVGAEICWSSKTELTEESFKDRVLEIYEKCKNEKFNNVVLAHEFLNNEELKSLFDGTHKFLAHNPIRLVRNILEDSSVSEESCGLIE